MNLDEDSIAELKHVFNINLYEAKLWLSILSRGEASASELSEVSNVPRSRAYDVLEALEKRGFVNAKLGKPIKYIAVNPEEVVEHVKREIEEEKNSKIKTTDSAKDKNSFKKILKLFNESGAAVTELSAPTAVRGRKNAYSRISSLISKAKKSVVIVSDEKGAFRKAYEFDEALKTAKQNGAHLKIVTKFSKKDDRIKKLKELFDIREHKGVIMRYVLVDDKIALFTSHADEVQPSNDTCVIINSSFITDSFKKIIP